MPANMSGERRACMAAYGAELITVPAGNMELARDLASQMQVLSPQHTPCQHAAEEHSCAGAHNLKIYCCDMQPEGIPAAQPMGDRFSCGPATFCCCAKPADKRALCRLEGWGRCWTSLQMQTTRWATIGPQGQSFGSRRRAASPTLCHPWGQQACRCPAAIECKSWCLSSLSGESDAQSLAFQ